MKDIGKNIKAIRQTKGMTQNDLADALYVTRQTVSNYENGRSRPDLDMLLKIAEILEADVNAVIYGPPLPQSKKTARKWAVASSAATSICFFLYFTVNAVFDGADYGYMFSIRSINRLAVLPVSMFLLGWSLLCLLSLLSGLEQIKKERVKIVRLVLLVVGCVLAVIPVPYIIFFGISIYRVISTSSVSMVFPYIPVYHEIFMGILQLIYHAPFVYTILGSLFWLFGLPDIKKNAE